MSILGNVLKKTMIRSSSSRRRKTPRTSPEPAHRSTGSLSRKPSVKFENVPPTSGADYQGRREERRDSRRGKMEDRDSRRGGMEDRDRRSDYFGNAYAAEDASGEMVNMTEYRYGRDQRFGQTRSSLVPEDAYNRSPRGSIDPNVLRSGRNSLLPDAEMLSRARPSMVADATVIKSSRNSLAAPEGPGRSASLVPDSNRSPRSSLIPDPNRSPRGSLAPDPSRSPRGSFVGDGRRALAVEMGANCTPRGSVASTDGTLVRKDSSIGRSPRGSDAGRTPRGSVDSITPAGASRPQKGTAAGFPNRTGSVKGPRTVTYAPHLDAVEDSRRASSSVSQVCASNDDRKHLCEQSRLNPESGTGLSAYGSFVYQLNHANMESSSVWDFVLRALRILYRTVVMTVILVCLTTLPLVMLIMGVEFARDCPKEPRLPIYMIVGGCFGLIKILWVIWRQIRSLRYERMSDPRQSSSAGTDDILDTSATTKIGFVCLSLGLVVWFAFGNYWILHIYWPEFEPTLFQPDRWCHKTLYIFSLVHLAVVYFFLFAVLVVTCAMASVQVCFIRCR